MFQQSLKINSYGSDNSELSSSLKLLNVNYIDLLSLKKNVVGFLYFFSFFFS